MASDVSATGGSLANYIRTNDFQDACVCKEWIEWSPYKGVNHMDKQCQWKQYDIN